MISGLSTWVRGTSIPKISHTGKRADVGAKVEHCLGHAELEFHEDSKKALSNALFCIYFFFIKMIMSFLSFILFMLQ